MTNTEHGLDLIFKPRSIAVVGASNTPGSVGKSIMDNLVWGDFPGTIYAVNLKPVSFPGLTSYPSISAIKDSVDCAIIAVPAAAVLKVMDQIVDAGIKAVIIISAGFKEAGPEGAILEQTLAKLCFDHGITLVGPNCLGVINPRAQLNASFAGSTAQIGSVAFVSQSGALCTAILDLANAYGLGFSKFMSIGNKAGLHDLDILEYLSADPDTKVIMMYIEDLKPHQDWVAAMYRVIHHPQHPKPVVVLKAGKSVEGAAASASHTGALAGDDAIYEAFFTQSGVIRAETIEDLFDLATVFTTTSLPKQSSVAIVTNAGGPGIITTDMAELHRLTLAHLLPTTAKSLHKILPPSANIHNPIDLIGDADSGRYQKALDIIARDNNVGTIMVILTPQAMTDPIKSAEAILGIKQQYSHLSLVVSFLGSELVQSGVELLRQSGIAVITYPDNAARAVAGLVQYSEFLRRSYPKIEHDAHVNAKVRSIVQTAVKNHTEYLLPEEASAVLSEYNIPIIKSGVAKSAVEAVKIAHEMKSSVALKIISPEIIHKTDVGGVMLNIAEGDVATAYEMLLKQVHQKAPNAKIHGMLVQEMSGLGQEVIIGAKRDAVFGPVLLFGLGGIYVEIVHDTKLMVAPLSKDQAEAMIMGIQAAPLLTGARGETARDIPALVDCILNVAKLMRAHPEIAAIDLNPVVAHQKGRGVSVLDARILIEEVAV